MFTVTLVDGLGNDLTITFSVLAGVIVDFVGVAVLILLFTDAALSFVGDLVASKRLLLKDGDPVYGEEETPDRSLNVGESRGEIMVCLITTRLPASAGERG